jgi:hypothetical protein
MANLDVFTLGLITRWRDGYAGRVPARILDKLPVPLPAPQLPALPVTRTSTTRLPATAIFLTDFCHFSDPYVGFFFILEMETLLNIVI